MSVPKAGALAKASDWTTVFPVDTDAWATWTPTVTQSVNVTFTTNRAKYTKVGRTVHLFGDLVVTGAGTAANTVVIGGLPVAAALGSFQNSGSGKIFDASASDNITGLVIFNGTTNTLSMLSTRAGGLLGVVTFTAALAVGDQINFHATYESVS